jgi:hypothetical protein
VQESAVANGAEAIREYLSVHEKLFELHPGMRPQGLHYAGDWDITLQHGEAFESVPWTTWRGRGYRRGRVRECFKNAFHVVMMHPADLTYCEGYAHSGLIACHHAWAVTEDGRVVDPTWRDSYAKGVKSKIPVRDWEYLGIPFDFDFLCRTVARKETYGILDDPKVYEQPLPPEAFAK